MSTKKSEENKRNQKANDLQPDQKTINNIIKNYIQNERILINQLHFKTSHGSTIGTYREEIWKDMFAQIIPKKFVIEQSVFIIDSSGMVSREVDLAIFDETYTPYIFRYGKLKFIPIEAVAVVIECKSTKINQNELKRWAESIDNLRASSKSYTRMHGYIAEGENALSKTQTGTRPIRILCCLNSTEITERLDNSDKIFDIEIRALNNKKKLVIQFDETKDSLQAWYLALNHVKGREQGQKEDGGAENKKRNDVSYDKGECLKDVTLGQYQVNHDSRQVSLMSLNFQLNQLLMLINNPMLFPHMAYAKLFDEKRKQEGQNE
jgi:hypothetical protein